VGARCCGKKISWPDDLLCGTGVSFLIAMKHTRFEVLTGGEY
jgi:hypothetical protein